MNHSRAGLNFRRIFWIALAVIIAGAALFWILHAPAKAKTAGRYGNSGPMPVVIATAATGDIDISLNQLGAVTPLDTVTVLAQISGQLTKVGFEEGQDVRKGDFLAEIDPRPYELALAQDTAQLAHDQALLQNARLDLERYRTLVAQDSIAKQTLDTQEALVQQYIATVASDEAAIKTANLNLNYCRITAPVTGRVGLRQVDPGNYVTSGNTSNGIVVVTQLQPMSVVFTVPEDSVPVIMKRLRTKATLQTEAYDRSNSVKLSTGKLSTLDNQIDTSTGTLKLRALFDNTDESLFPNQFVNIRLLVDTLHDVIVIPTAAIQRGAKGTYVYLVNADNSTVSMRPVTLGPTSGDNVAVDSGLAAGDRAVIDGADKLRDGAKIMLPAAASDSGAAKHADAESDTNPQHKKGTHKHQQQDPPKAP
jgi:multidrug efflux system membrane fusion protein